MHGCGLGNVLIDGLMKLLFDEEYDDCGQVGSRGSVDQELLQCLIDEDLFVLKDPPKSTGREVSMNIIMLYYLALSSFCKLLFPLGLLLTN